MEKVLKIKDWLAIEDRLKNELNPVRYQHTLGVTYTAAALAMNYCMDEQQARLAGLLHDCAKCIPDEEKLKLCREHPEIGATEFETAHPYLLHSKLGAYVAKEVYGVDDPEILSSIKWHTTGRPAMTRLEQIIYIADYIEPNRDDELPDLTEIRRLAFEDLDKASAAIMKASIDYIRSSGKSMDTMTIDAYNYYKSL